MLAGDQCPHKPTYSVGLTFVCDDSDEMLKICIKIYVYLSNTDAAEPISWKRQYIARNVGLWSFWFAWYSETCAGTQISSLTTPQLKCNNPSMVNVL